MGADARVRFKLEVDYTNRHDCWVARATPTGITVYAESKAAARARMDHALNFFMSAAILTTGILGLKAYLDKHGVASEGSFLSVLSEDTFADTGIAPEVELVPAL